MFLSSFLQFIMFTDPLSMKTIWYKYFHYDQILINHSADFETSVSSWQIYQSKVFQNGQVETGSSHFAFTTGKIIHL